MYYTAGSLDGAGVLRAELHGHQRGGGRGSGQNGLLVMNEA